MYRLCASFLHYLFLKDIFFKKQSKYVFVNEHTSSSSYHFSKTLRHKEEKLLLLYAARHNRPPPVWRRNRTPPGRRENRAFTSQPSPSEHSSSNDARRPRQIQRRSATQNTVQDFTISLFCKLDSLV